METSCSSCRRWRPPVGNDKYGACGFIESTKRFAFASDEVGVIYSIDDVAKARRGVMASASDPKRNPATVFELPMRTMDSFGGDCSRWMPIVGEDQE